MSARLIMRQHIEALVAPFIDDDREVEWCQRPGCARVIRDLDNTVIEFRLPYIRSAISYAVALHELGHALGRYQSSHNAMVRERWAWQWARANAVSWTPAMERCAVVSLRLASQRVGKRWGR
jgi:hypothetical protein